MKSIQGSDLSVAGFEFVPDGGKLARKGVGTIALAGESQFLLRCDGCVCLRRLQHLGVRGSEKCGPRLGLPAARPPPAPPPPPREFRPEGGKPPRGGVFPAPLLIKRLLLLYLGLG